MMVLKLAEKYCKLPSEIIGIDDSYTSYCFDEACMFIQLNLEKKDGPKPIFKEDRVDENLHFSSMSDMYKHILKG